MTQDKTQTEKEKYLAWHKDQVENHGLIECRPYLNPDRPEGTTEEDIYREMNEMNDAVARGETTPLTGI